MGMTIFVIIVLITAAITAGHACVNGARILAAVLTFGVIVGVIALITEGVSA